MILRRQAIAAPEADVRQEFKWLARIALLCAKLAPKQRRRLGYASASRYLP
jgi:hypothetical protein